MVSELTKGSQLGPIVMEVGVEVSSTPLTPGVAPPVFYRPEGWRVGASLYLLWPQSALCAVTVLVPSLIP